MESLNTLLRNVLHYNNEFCRLCFNTVDKDEIIRLYDEVILDNQDTKEMAEVLSIVLASQFQMSELEVICNQCAQSAVFCYKFIMMSKENFKHLNSFIDCLTSCAANTMDELSDYKTLFLQVNMNDETSNQYYEVNCCTPSSAFEKFCSIFHAKPLNSISDSFSTDDEFSETVPVKRARNPKLKQEDICSILNTADGSTKYQCNFCSLQCTKYANLQRHYRNLHTEQSGKTSSKPVKVRRSAHVAVKVSPDTPPVKRVKKPRVMKEDMCSIVQTVDGFEKFQCKICMLTFTTYGSVQRHYSHLHDKQPKVAKSKTRPYKSINTPRLKKEDISSIVQAEDGSERLQCNVCLATFSIFPSLERHYTKNHTDESKRNFVCSTCGKTFKDVYILRVHESRHDCSQKLVCPECKRVYANRSYLKMHICRKEYVPLPKTVQCHLCDKKFGRQRTLKYHIISEHDQSYSKFYFCMWCHKKFLHQSALNNHITTHTQEKKFKCDVCEGHYVTKTSLLYHMRTHTGEKPYACKLCDQKFLSASRRTEHVRRHHMEASLKCGICPKKFKNYGGLNRHRRRHSNPNSSLYKPTLCDKDED